MPIKEFLLLTIMTTSFIGCNSQKIDGLNGLQSRSLDTLDGAERKLFNTVSVQEILKEVKPLDLPREDKNDEKVNNTPLVDRLIILVFENNGIYAYTGDDIKAGKAYTYKEFKSFLIEKRSNKDLVVFIKPSKTCTYKNTVDMLDEMTLGSIKKYTLVDITKGEEDFLNNLPGRN